jgi:small GTP-binding protein
MQKTIKLIVCGDDGVGKSSFLNRLIHGNFNNNSDLTGCIDFFSKILTSNGYKYNFVMWDFAGQRQFKDILSNFVDRTNSAFILFDLSRFSTFESVERWIQKLNNYGNILLFIIATKSDLIDLDSCRIIDNYVSQILSKYKNVMGYLKISSKTGYNVKRAFNFLIKVIQN